uniref:Uncharacterized protein n=1 Tax=Arundo donax TaxID=35708 RepID=A0A0A9H041_ARUDO
MYEFLSYWQRSLESQRALQTWELNKIRKDMCYFILRNVINENGILHDKDRI